MTRNWLYTYVTAKLLSILTLSLNSHVFNSLYSAILRQYFVIGVFNMYDRDQSQNNVKQVINYTKS